MMKNMPFVIFLFLSIAGLGQTDKSVVSFINPPSVSIPKGYSHAAGIDLGTCTMLIISGQVSLDSNGNLVGKGDFEKQAEQVFSNIRNIVIAGGGSMDHIVKINIYTTDISMIQILRDVRDKFINKNNRPASTLVEVKNLFRDDFMLEIEATAIIPKKQK